MSKRRALSGLALAAVVALSACGGDDGQTTTSTAGAATGTESGAIKVKAGIVGPKTGPLTHYWVDHKRGAELALKDYADKANIDLEFVEMDDQAQPEIAARAVQKLLNEDQVDVILGPTTSGTALQAADTIQRTGRPWIVGFASDDAIAQTKQPENWAFHTNNNNGDAITVTGSALFAGGDKVGLIGTADGYGQSNVTALQKYAKKNNHEIAAVELIQPGSSDQSAAIRKMKDAGVESLYMAITTGADTAAVTKSMRQQNYNPKKQYVTATVLADYRELATPEEWTKLTFVDSRDLSKGWLQGVAKEYEETYGEEPKVLGGLAGIYAGTTLYLDAVAKVKDPKDYAAVRKAMEDAEQLQVKDFTIDAPFSATDHELFEDDPTQWFVHSFDEQGNVVTQGTVAAS